MQSEHIIIIDVIIVIAIFNIILIDLSLSHHITRILFYALELTKNKMLKDLQSLCYFQKARSRFSIVFGHCDKLDH